MNFYVFSLCHYHLPLKNVCGLLVDQTWIPFIQGCFVPNLVEICPVVLEKKIFLKVINTFSLCWYYLPLNKVVILFFQINFKLLYIGVVWLRLVHWISLFCKGCRPSFRQTWIPGLIQQIFISFSLNVLCWFWKTSRQRRWERTTDKLPSENFTWVFS